MYFKGIFFLTRNPPKSVNIYNKLDLVRLCDTQKISMKNCLYKNIPHMYMLIVESFWHLVLSGSPRITSFSISSFLVLASSSSFLCSCCTLLVASWTEDCTEDMGGERPTEEECVVCFLRKKTSTVPGASVNNN